MGNVHMEATQINYREGGTKMSVAQAIKNAGSEITPEEKTWIDSIPALTTSNAGKTDQDVIAPEFDAESGVYAVGDKVMYDGKLYKFTTAHETPGDWDSTEVSETTVDDELSSLESGLSDVNSNLTTLSNNVIKVEGSGLIPSNGSEELTLLPYAAAYIISTCQEDSVNYSALYYVTYNANGVYGISPIVSANSIAATAQSDCKVVLSNSGSYGAYYKVLRIA